MAQNVIDIIPEEGETRIQFIKDQILQKLGYPSINVELTPQQLTFQITKQLMEYSKEILYLDWTVVTIDPNNPTGDGYSAQLYDQKNRRITQLKEVVVADDEFINFANIYKQYLLQRTGIEEIIKVMSYYDVQRKILRPEVEWTFQQRDSKVVVYRRFESQTRLLIFYFVIPLIEDIYQNDINWIINFSTQECKEILGRVRSKIQSINTTVGQIQLDGQQLLSEQQQEKQQLLEEIKQTDSWFIEPITVF